MRGKMFISRRAMDVALLSGAFIIIVGEIFRINHWPGAATLTIAGMVSETLIFIAMAIQRTSKEQEKA